MSLFAHPLWAVGFRPFFALAAIAGALFPAAWIALLEGATLGLSPPVPPLQWHAHEMFFGFGWAVLGGFLLTASKNWVGIRGYHGAALAWLTAAWLFERLGMAYGAHWPAALRSVSAFAFLISIVGMLGWTLVRHRATDTYRDNVIFLVVLPAFLAAKWLLLDPAHFRLGADMTLALFRVAFLVMLERTLTQFMKAAFRADILRDPRLDGAIKGLALVAVFADLMPAAAAAGVEAVLAVLLAIRFAFWHPRQAFTRVDIGIMHVGYLGIVAQLLLQALDRTVHPGWVGALPVHAFTFGAMGLIVPAMLVRISKGHTGRRVVFEPADKAALHLMIVALLARLVAPQMLPGAYAHWLHLAAALWFAAFGLVALRIFPMVSAARVDGREH
ncbi:MAG TPA: NnrS family protein [Rhodocyclaceae bacterium]|nr:NnrS family protein [Rhodocyclaceae bacterium]